MLVLFLFGNGLWREILIFIELSLGNVLFVGFNAKFVNVTIENVDTCNYQKSRLLS